MSTELRYEGTFTRKLTPETTPSMRRRESDQAYTRVLGYYLELLSQGKVQTENGYRVSEGQGPQGPAVIVENGPSRLIIYKPPPL